MSMGRLLCDIISKNISTCLFVSQTPHVNSYKERTPSSIKRQATADYQIIIILKWIVLKGLLHLLWRPLLSVLPEKEFFCDCCGQKSLIMRHIFLKNAMEYAGYLWNFMWWNCGNLQKLWFDEKERKKWFPNTLLFKKTLFQKIVYRYSVITIRKQIRYKNT